MLLSLLCTLEYLLLWLDPHIIRTDGLFTKTLPYLREWAAKYQDQGLSVNGVHTPEFGFERNVDNVIAAARDMRVDYPIALDSNYAVWEGGGKLERISGPFRPFEQEIPPGPY
jgi:hypothetical protein